MRNIRFIRTILLSLTMGLMAPATVLAASTPQLYVDTPSVNASSGSSFVLPVRINGNGSNLNAVNVVVSYPADQLTFVGLDKTGSFFDSVVPATPTAHDGSVTFGVAALGTSTSSDVLVSRLLFTAIASSGTAHLSLTGSEAANAGAVIPVNAGTATVSFSAASAGSASSVTPSNITVSDRTVNGAVVHWHTATASSSTVDYGTTKTYGLSASSSGLTTDHSVALAGVFAGRTTVHYRVTSVTADGHSGVSADQTFVTKGYVVTLTINDTHGNPIAHVSVAVGDSPKTTTDAHGMATIQNVPGGNQKVYVGNNAAQLITVKEVAAKDSTTPQHFTVVAARNRTVTPAVLLIVLLILLATVLYVAGRKRSTPSSL